MMAEVFCHEVQWNLDYPGGPFGQRFLAENALGIIEGKIDMYHVYFGSGIIDNRGGRNTLHILKKFQW